MRRFGFALLLVGLLAVAPPAAALDVTASVDSPRVALGGQIVLTVEVSGGLRDVGEPKLPDLGDAFEVFRAGTSRSFSIVNGRTSSSLSYRYVLRPRREGTFTIGTIEVEDKGSVARTQPIQVTVASAPAAASPPRAATGDGGATVGDRDVFVKATVDKTRPYLFEQVTYRLALHNRVRLLDAPRLNGMTTEGFWREDFPRAPASTVTIDGDLYQVWEVAVALFPTTPGDLTIKDAAIECEVQVRRGNRDPFSLFGGGLFDSRTVPLTADPVTVHVRPLPDGAPAGFAGAVGDYKLEVTADRTTVAQNDPVTLKMTVSGNGNLRTLGDLPAPRVTDFRVYPQQKTEDMGLRGSVFGGTVSQEFVLVPLSAGKKMIPPVEIATFSPGAGEYRVLRSAPIELEVSAAAPGAPGTPAPRAGIEVVGRDIRFIETDLPHFTRTGSGPEAPLRWLALIPLPLLAWAGAAVSARRRNRLSSDVALRRRSRARRDALRALRAAVGDGDLAGRAELAAGSVRGFAADRWNLPRAGITDDAIAERLRGQDVDPAPLLSFLARCDAARYAPGMIGEGPWDPAAEARTWIDRLEKTR